MYQLTIVVLSLAILGGCSTQEPNYRVGATGTEQSREEAEQAHAKLIASVASAAQLDPPLKSVLFLARHASLITRHGLYGSTTTSTNAGRLSAPFLSVTRSLNR